MPTAHSSTKLLKKGTNVHKKILNAHPLSKKTELSRQTSHERNVKKNIRQSHDELNAQENLAQSRIKCNAKRYETQSGNDGKAKKIVSQSHDV